MIDVSAMSMSACHTGGANKSCTGFKTELVTCVPPDTSLSLHLLPEAILILIVNFNYSLANRKDFIQKHTTHHLQI